MSEKEGDGSLMWTVCKITFYRDGCGGSFWEKPRILGLIPSFDLTKFRCFNHLGEFLK